MQENPSAFDSALSNFTFGMANKDLICHMADEGYSVKQIKAATDYPVSLEKIAETVWEFYIETGMIRLNPPDKANEPRYDYVMDIGKYGKRSFRRVEIDTGIALTENNTNRTASYVKLDIGIIKAHEPALYQKMLTALDSRKRDYIDGLPWPDKTVYHIDNLAIREIMDIWSEM